MPLMKQADISEFKASLVYKATQRSPVSTNQKRKVENYGEMEEKRYY